MVQKNRDGFYVVALMESFQDCRRIQIYRRRLGMESILANVNGTIWVFADVKVQWEIMIDAEQ